MDHILIKSTMITLLVCGNNGSKFHDKSADDCSHDCQNVKRA